MKRELSEVKTNTAQLPTKQYITEEDGALVEIDLVTGSRKRYEVRK